MATPSTTRGGHRVRLVVALLSVILAGSVLAVTPASAQGAPQITGCAVASAEGGINVSWNPLPIAVERYVYRIETAGNPPRYGNTQDTNDFIAVDGTATIFVGAFITGTGYTAAADCGSATGGDPGPTNNPTCSIASAQGGVEATWDAIDGAVSYVWRREITGQPNRYNRTTNTSAVVPVPNGTTAQVFVSAVLADGSYSPAIACGSAVGGEGIPTSGPTCTVASADGGVMASWSAVDGAVRYVYRYVLSTSPGIARYDRSNTLGDLVLAPTGVSVSVWVSGQRADGSYTGAVPCGSALAGGGTEPPDPTGPDCTFQWFPDSNVTVEVRWNELPDAQSSDIVIAGNSIFQSTNTLEQRVWSVDPSNLPTTGTITTTFANRAPQTDTCVVVDSIPTATLEAPAAECSWIPDVDGSDLTIEYAPSGSGVESWVFVDRFDAFAGRSGTFGRTVTSSPVRSQGNFGAFVSYLEVVDGASTQVVACPIVLPADADA